MPRCQQIELTPTAKKRRLFTGIVASASRSPPSGRASHTRQPWLNPVQAPMASWTKPRRSLLAWLWNRIQHISRSYRRDRLGGSGLCLAAASLASSTGLATAGLASRFGDSGFGRRFGDSRFATGLAAAGSAAVAASFTAALATTLEQLSLRSMPARQHSTRRRAWTAVDFLLARYTQAAEGARNAILEHLLEAIPRPRGFTGDDAILSSVILRVFDWMLSPSLTSASNTLPPSSCALA